MASPDDRRYLETHEWHKRDGDVVTIGISQFATEELTDITYVEVNKQSGLIKAGEPFGEIESVKATSELYSGISGEVLEVNQAVIDNPALINEYPYDKGWIVRIKADDPGELEKLQSATDYDQQHASG